MIERYLPPSDFLKAVADEDAPLSGSAFADANLRRLIEMISDPDRSNRDWAAMLLAHEEVDSPTIRQALLEAADDEDACVRAEAIVGLAIRDRSVALPFVRRELGRTEVPPPIFEAAALVADPSLIPDLECFAEPSGRACVDSLAVDALAASSRSAGAGAEQ
jgi:hypothetical protein